MMKRGLIIKISIILLLAIIIFFFSKFFLASHQDNENQDITPIRVIDGDTFQTSEGEKIRLLCVDTPEPGEEGYEEAKSYLSLLIFGKEISIERARIDDYNRTLAWVTTASGNESALVNKKIVDSGYGDLFEYGGNNCSDRMNSY